MADGEQMTGGPGKTWLERTNPNWAFAAAFVLLLAVLISPFVEGKRLPFSMSLQTEANADAQKSWLIEWLQIAQREADGARRSAAAAEAQQATLSESLQQAQRERDEARKERDRLQKEMQAQQSHPLRWK